MNNRTPAMNNQPSARVLAHSVNAVGSKLVTFEIKCHRWILAEINTHRMLSRNFRSSRAVPFAKLCEEVITNPAMPIVWLQNKPGMQASEPMEQQKQIECQLRWRGAAEEAVYQAKKIATLGLHKQWVNRLIEPFLFVHGVISGTEWSNFYARRRAADAQPEFKALADIMWEAHKASKPCLLGENEWHLPYVDESPYSIDWPTLRKLSVARVARVSYKPHTGEDSDQTAEFDRHDKLLANGHMSPFEHQARPWSLHTDGQTILSGNFDASWTQYRKLIPGENITSYNPGNQL